MLKNYFKIALRNLFKQKMFSAINIFGLAIGFAGSLIISVFVWNELSYETMHENRGDIYRIAMLFGNTDDGMQLPGCMPALGPALKDELPEVEEFVHVFYDRTAEIKLNQNKFNVDKFFLADESILDVFTINILSKSEEKPLSQPFSILL